MFASHIDEIGRTFDAHADEIWGSGFDPRTVPMLFLGADPEGTTYAIGCGPLVHLDLRSAEVEVDGGPTTGPNWGILDPEFVQEFCRYDEEVTFTPALGAEEGIVFDLRIGTHSLASREFARFVVHETFHQHQIFTAR